MTPKKTHILILIALPLFIFGVSLFFNPVLDTLGFRIGRAFTVFSFLGLILFLRKGLANRSIVFFMLFLGLSGLASLGYENTSMAILTMSLTAISYAFLVGYLVPKVKLDEMSLVFTIGLIVVSLVNVWLLLEFLTILRAYVDNLVLFVVICFSSIDCFIVAVCTFFYNHQSTSQSSLMFLFFILFMLFAEVFRGCGYYGFIDEVQGQYFERFLFVISFAFLYQHFYLSDKKRLL